MSNVKYLLRFDDICPTMKWSIWNEVEKIMDLYGIRPIIAVIPHNADPALLCEKEREDYWDVIRNWQSKGWHIALHGYSHHYENKNSGIIKVNDYSEFAGVSKEEQGLRIKKGLEIFTKQGIYCDMWVAPAHSFDENTIKCLKENNIRLISDGYSDDLFLRDGMTWIPCQLYKFENRDSGVWTVCKHPSMWGKDDLEKFRTEIEEWHSAITTVEEVLNTEISREKSQEQWKISKKCCQRLWRRRKSEELVNHISGRIPMLKKVLVKIVQRMRGENKLIEDSRKKAFLSEKDAV